MRLRNLAAVGLALTLALGPAAAASADEWASGPAVSCGTTRYLYTKTSSDTGTVYHYQTNSGILWSKDFVNSGTQTRYYTKLFRSVSSWSAQTTGSTNLFTAGTVCQT